MVWVEVQQMALISAPEPPAACYHMCAAGVKTITGQLAFINGKKNLISISHFAMRPCDYRGAHAVTKPVHSKEVCVTLGLFTLPSILP